MKRLSSPLSSILLLLVVLSSIALSASAHPGRTDGRGGHTDHSTGEYHYHHGYSAHDHYDIDGDGDVDCPYDFNDAAATKATHSKSTEASGFDLLRCIELVMTTMSSVAMGAFILAQVIVFFSEDFSAILFKITFGTFFLMVPILFLYLIAIVINAIIG